MQESRKGWWVSCYVVSDSCNSMDCRPPGSSVHGILQARILEWVAISFSRGSSWPRNRIWISCTAGIVFTNGATREAQKSLSHVRLFETPWTIQSMEFSRLKYGKEEKNQFVLGTCCVSRLWQLVGQRASSVVEKPGFRAWSLTREWLWKVTKYVGASVSSSAKQGEYLWHKGVTDIQNNCSMLETYQVFNRGGGDRESFRRFQTITTETNTCLGSISNVFI